MNTKILTAWPKYLVVPNISLPFQIQLAYGPANTVDIDIDVYSNFYDATSTQQKRRNENHTWQVWTTYHLVIIPSVWQAIDVHFIPLEGIHTSDG